MQIGGVENPDGQVKGRARLSSPVRNEPGAGLCK